MTRANRWILIAAVLGSGAVFLDGTVVNVALPRIGRDLPSHLFGVLEGQSYVYNGYLLTLSALLILAGAISDFYGRRRMFAVGLGGFGVASVLCGLAPNMEFLIAFRVLQGAFGALLVPGSLSLITAAFSGEEQGKAFGIWAGASAGTTILGPFIGGILVDTVSWRAAFLINVPFIAVAMYALLTHVDESHDETATGKFDWLGAAVVALAVGGLAFGVIYGQQRAWRDPLGFVALGVGVVATILLPVLMVRSANPLIPPRLFRSRTFTVTNISTLVIYGALYVTFYYLGLYMQGTVGYTAAAAGLAGIPGTLFLVFFSKRFGTLGARYGPRWFMAAGPVVMALGVLWYARVPASTRPWVLVPSNAASFVPPTSYLVDLLPGSILFGMGLMMLVAPLTTALMSSVPVHNSGVASAINNAISRVGPQLAGAGIFVALTASFYGTLGNRLPGLDTGSPSVRAAISPLNQPQAPPPGYHGAMSDLTSATRQASNDAFRLAMLVGAGLLLVGGVVNAVGIQSQPGKAPDARAADPQGSDAAAVA